MIVCHGHQFVPHKSSEMICWSCGFVIWSVESVQDAEQALTELQGGQGAMREKNNKVYHWLAKYL